MRSEIDNITETLGSRGAYWQAAGFAIIATTSLVILSIYSDSDHWTISAFRIAVTQLIWGYLAPVALAIEGARAVFETKAQLRSKATAKAVAKAEEQGRRDAEDRILAILRRHDVELGPEAEKEIFGKNGRDD